MKEYRVVSNGLNYRVQWLGKTRILRRLKWYWLWDYSHAGSYIAEFSYEREAHFAIRVRVQDDKAKKQGYIPVEVE